MNAKKILTVLIAAVFALSACSKKPPVVTEPRVEEKPKSSAQNFAPAQNDREQEMARLEAERRRLEELMNRIMSSEIYFDYDRAVLKPAAYEILSQIGDILKKEPRLSVVIEGHTDERGTESYNMTLGEKRAYAVRSYLQNYGIPADRLGTVSYGEERPKVAGHDESAWSQNRRAAFQVNIL